MSRTTLTVVVFLAAFFGSPRVHAEWESLFNGRDLSGWTRLNGSAPFRVEDGAIVGVFVEDSPNTFLCTDQRFGDFALELEYKIDDGCNSGIQFRSASDPARDGRVFGYQCEIDTSARRWSSGIYDEARRGWLYPVELNPGAKTAFLPGRWNHLRIECIGTSIRTWLNGRAVSHVIDDASREGFIGLQVHSIGGAWGTAGGEVRWRSIRIDTDPQPVLWGDPIFVRNTIPNHLDASEQARGWRLLFDGSSTDGWRGAHKRAFPERGWSVRDGALIVEASGGGESTHAGDIVTTDEFGAFELQLEFKPTEGANSGIKYFVTEGYLTHDDRRSAIGLEYQILDDERHVDAGQGVVGNRTMASLYDLIPSSREVIGRTVPRLVGEWNHARLIVHPDNRVEHWLNGYKVVEYVRGSNVYNALVARSKYKDWEGFGMAATGHILLQDHGDEVWFRSVKIRELIAPE